MTPKDSLDKALANLENDLRGKQQREAIPFESFLKLMLLNPRRMMRNVFQIFHDMVKNYVSEEMDEYPDDPESIHYINYDFAPLLEHGCDHPFFADRLFANRFMHLVEALRLGAQQNKIYVFEGPHGSGKSTFLNNLLKKFEEYTNTMEGGRYEVVWRLSRDQDLGVNVKDKPEVDEVVGKLIHTLRQEGHMKGEAGVVQPTVTVNGDYIDVACPSHDHPVLVIPKGSRRIFLDDLFSNNEFKWMLFTEKEYEWVFHDSACTICSALYDALLHRLKSPSEVFSRIHARPCNFNRRLGEGISVFSPGDRPLRETVLTNSIVQQGINSYLKDSNQVRYVFSHYAKTNNGIYALMDIKGDNVERMTELHNIISEGVHKVEDIEENVNTLLFALMNPEDRKNIENFQSFSDRIEYINIPYVLDLHTVIKIYRNIFGRKIDESFLPRVLHNFARIIVSSRLLPKSEAMLEWIGDPGKYKLYCDDKLHLLKMEIYAGHIPPWLSEEDRKRFTAKRRRRIIDESEHEGASGFSGRDSIKIFNEFYSAMAREDRLINMSMLIKFFENYMKTHKTSIPEGFMEALGNMYDHRILQEVKESLYYYNEDQISREIQNYLFAVNFEQGETARCSFTGDRITVGEEFFRNIEFRLLGQNNGGAAKFRHGVQKEYTSVTLTQEMLRDGLPITETSLYLNLYERYVYNLKEKVLDPFLENENFRRAVKDYGSEAFKTYDLKIRNDVSYLIGNLCEKFKYTKLGAREVCTYVIDNNIAQKFSR